MDPTVNLKEQRKCAKRIQQLTNEIDGNGGWDDQQLAEEGARLAKLVLALDEWLVSGGFLPKDWITPLHKR